MSGHWLATSWRWNGSFFEGMATVTVNLIQPIVNAYGIGPLVAAMMIVSFCLVLWDRVKK